MNTKCLKETVPQFSCNDIPIVRMSSEGISFNNACVNLLPQANYAQTLVNYEKKLLLVRTSPTKDKNAFCWVPTDNQIIVVDASLFFGKLREYTDWRIDYVYSMCGTVIMLDGKKALSFDMTSAVREEYEQPKNHRTPPKTQSIHSTSGIIPLNQQFNDKPQAKHYNKHRKIQIRLE